MARATGHRPGRGGGGGVRRLAAIGLAGALLAAGATACAEEEEEWWAADIAEAPCELGMTPAVERETGQRVVSTEVIRTGYETVCAHEMTGDARVDIYVFHAGPGTVEALGAGRAWTPGSTSQTGYQGLTRRRGATQIVFVRGVVEEVGAQVSVTLDVPDAELVAAGEALAVGAARAVLARR